MKILKCTLSKLLIYLQVFFNFVLIAIYCIHYFCTCSILLLSDVDIIIISLLEKYLYLFFTCYF